MPWDQTQLPELGPGTPIEQDDNSVTRFLRKRKITGELGPIDYEISSKKLKLESQYKDALVKALLGYDGNSSISVSKPLFGGNVDINAARRDGQNSYNLQYQKRF